MLNTILNLLNASAPALLTGFLMLLITDLYKGLKTGMHRIALRISKSLLQRKLEKKENELSELKKELSKQKPSDRQGRKALRQQKKALGEKIKNLKSRIRSLERKLQK